MPNQEGTLYGYKLPAGTKFSSCSPSKSCGDVKVTSKDRVGDLVLKYDKGEVLKAVFYSPDLVCTSPECDLVATFVGKEFDTLSKDKEFLTAFKTTFLHDYQAGPSKQDIPGKTDNNIFTPIYFIIGVPLLLMALLVIFRIFRLPSPPNTRQARSIGARKTAAGGQTLQPNTARGAPSAVTGDISQHLSTMQAQISQLNAKLGKLETELIVMGQKIDTATPKVSPVISRQPVQPSFGQNSAPPRQLDISLIKEAVATADYGLLKNFSHDFVTETLDSRQGKEEGVRFSIDGNQETYEQRSQSEFIAIAYANETYLVPNILPNATDPARTIKRHIDRNKVYRGDSQNLLNLSEVATVERSGDSYILAKPGRIG